MTLLDGEEKAIRAAYWAAFGVLLTSALYQFIHAIKQTIDEEGCGPTMAALSFSDGRDDRDG
jgi:hypothetical protein